MPALAALLPTPFLRTQERDLVRHLQCGSAPHLTADLRLEHQLLSFCAVLGTRGRPERRGLDEAVALRLFRRLLFFSARIALPTLPSFFT